MQQNSLENIEDKAAWWEILLMMYLLAITGNPFLSQDDFKIFLAVLPAIYLLKNYKSSVSYRTILIFIFFLGYELMHALMFKLDYFFTIIKIFLVLLFSVVVVDILKNRFVLVFTRTMVIISLISFVFYILCYIPGINTFLYNLGDTLFPLEDNFANYHTPTLLIFTFFPEFFTGSYSYVRNAGMFWESGAFAVFLNISLYLHYSTRKITVIKDLFDKDSVILIIALITTTSTMGVVALFFILTFFSLHLKTALKYILIILVTISSYIAFSSVEFLGAKISKQLSESGKTNNRFGSFLMDMEHIMKHPLLGSSRRLEVLYGSNKYTAKTHRPNGLSTFLKKYGLVYFSIYYILVYLSFRKIYFYHHGRYNNMVAFVGIILLLIISFSENIWDLAFSKSLMFLFSAYYITTRLETSASIGKPFFFHNKLSAPAGK